MNCDTCGKSFFNKSDLKKHKKSLHDGVTYACKICQRSYSWKENLNAHMKTTHKIGKIKEFKCIPCDLEYSNHTGLRFHKLSKHDGIQHQCTKCDKTFSLKINLNHHFKRLHEEQLKLIHCILCKKSFKSNGDLKKHIECVHERVKFKCEACGKSVIGKKSLIRHVKNVHKKVKQEKKSQNILGAFLQT